MYWRGLKPLLRRGWGRPYDLVSGKVNEVAYQHGRGDQFYYKYKYDADNRVISSLSSRDKLVWTEDAAYTYYLHGPLARTELGHYKVQGVDYAYTLQGWLKGINSDSLNAVTEMGGDGYHGSPFARVSRDVYGFKLGYYNNDYVPIDVANASGFAVKSYTAPGTLENTGNQLFNGNISFTTLALSKINNGATAGYSYGYDQLNRLTEMRQHTTGTTGGWSNSNIHTAYSESIAYDANGNILKYLRRGTAATPDMDSMNYAYNRDEDGNIVNNRLNHVRDAVSSTNYTVDIDDQSEDNYAYDYIGNLKSDDAEGLLNIDWTVYGKIKKIDKASGSDIEYGYDPGGNRATKKVYGAADTITYYVRDAQGNVMGIYTRQGSDALRWNEQHLYGSSRLGIWNWDTLVPGSPPVVDEEPIYDSLLLGSRTYELSNHLGNVLSTISDKKIGNDSSDVVNYYIAEVLSQNDYYPFGMGMPGRKYINGSYRYGFNGKEDDNEITGEGTIYDFGDRLLDVRIGRWLKVDRLFKTYSYASPYVFALNTVIQANDPDGERIFFVNGYYNTGKLQKWAGSVGGRPYWGGARYEQAAQAYFKDYATLTNDNFIDGRGTWNSSGKERYEAGYEYAKANFQKLTAGMAQGETIKIVSHSMGGAYSEGMIKYLEDNGTYKVEKVVHLSMADVSDFKISTSPTTIQLNHKNDIVLGYKNFDDFDFNTETDKAGIVDKGTMETAHADTKFDPNVFKELEDLENISFTQDPNDNRNPLRANWIPSGNANGTIFKQVTLKLTPQAPKKSTLRMNQNGKPPKYKIGSRS